MTTRVYIPGVVEARWRLDGTWVVTTPAEYKSLRSSIRALIREAQRGAPLHRTEYVADNRLPVLEALAALLGPQAKIELAPRLSLDDLPPGTVH